MTTPSRYTALYHPVDIGRIRIDGNVFLAPLAGYTDRAFRSVCIDHGASFTYTEMVSAEGLYRDSMNTTSLVRRADNEQSLGIQIFMNDASVVERSLEKLLACNPTVIDINCGCPVPKVVKTGAGSALLRFPEKINGIVRVIKTACDIPVSVKIRLGWDASSINYQETTDAALDAGVDMVTMHARTKAMGYSGHADWQALADLKRYVASKAPRVPVFGSGDLFSARAAKEMLVQTNVDGIMFARGAMGNPFIFEDAIRLLTTGEEPLERSTSIRVETMLTQLHRMGADVGERLACREMRKHATSYLKGIPHASQAKQALVRASTYAEYATVCERLITEGPAEL
jgi:nifR3 family TIM-barrel protein